MMNYISKEMGQGGIGSILLFVRRITDEKLGSSKHKKEGVSIWHTLYTLMDTYRVKLTASYSLDELAGPVLCEFTETSI